MQPLFLAIPRAPKEKVEVTEVTEVTVLVRYAITGFIGYLSVKGLREPEVT